MRSRVEVARRGRTIGAAFVLVLSISACVSATGAAAARSPFRPGLYVGETSQGEPVMLRLTVGGSPCEGEPCLFAANDESEVHIAETCTGAGAPAGESLDLDLFETEIPASGIVRADSPGTAKLTATFKVGHDGALTGRLRATTTLEGGIRCDSGNVTLKAKIGGRTG